MCRCGWTAGLRLLQLVLCGRAAGASASSLVPEGFKAVAGPGSFVEPGRPVQFRWGLRCKAEQARLCRGLRQRAWHLSIAAANGGVALWASGRVSGAETSAVAPAGLPPDAAFAAELRVWAGAAGDGSSPAVARTAFRTALPDGRRPGGRPGGDWQGTWIAGGTQLRGRFNASLPAGTSVLSAIAYTSGVGCFSLSFNGQLLTGVGCDPNISGEACDSYLDPGFSTVPSVRLLYRAFDVSKMLRDGANVVGARLGQCKYGYLETFCSPADAWQPACRAFLLQLNIRFSDGRSQNFTTSAADGAWQATTAGNPIVYTHLYHGEVYDARLEQAGWDAPGAGDAVRDSTWAPAVAYPRMDDLGVLSLFMTPTVRVTERRQAESLSSLPDAYDPQRKVWLFDFGQNWAGFATLRVSGLPAGTAVVLRYAELVHADGSLFNDYCDATCAGPPWAGPMDGLLANQTDVFISGGRGEETYTPSFTYHGYRYVSIEGLPADYAVSNDTLTSLFVHSDTPAAGHVHFANESLAILNSIQTAILYTQRSNFHTIPTDCPQREKRGWMGDAQWTAKEASLNLDTSMFYRSWLRSIADSQELGCQHVDDGGDGVRPPTYECCSRAHPTFGCDWTGVVDNFTDSNGSVPDVVPYDRKTYGAWPGDPTWGAAVVEIPYQSWRLRGDLEALAEAYPAARAFVEFLYRHIDAEVGLIQFGYYGDWLPLNNTATSAVTSFSQVLAVSRLVEMAAALQLGADVARYQSMLAQLKAAWHARYYSAAAGSYAGGTQTGNALALYLGVPPTPEIREQVAKSLADGCAETGYHPTFGGVGSRVLFAALADSGHMDVAIEMATQTTSPSFGYMVQQGPGTLWEEWGGDAHTAQGSKNHPMFGGGIGAFLYQLAGLASSHSYRRHALRLDPVAVERVGAAEAWLDTPSGRLSWSWARRPGDGGGTLELRIHIPHGPADLQLELPTVARAGSRLLLVEEGAPARESQVWPAPSGGAGGGALGGVEVSAQEGALVLQLGPGAYAFALREGADAVVV